MTQDPRVLNLTRGFRLKRAQAFRAVENCACVWVEFGVSVRDLTIAEAIVARNIQAANREPLAHAELPGIMFDGLTDYGLVRAANEFVAQAV